MGGAEQVAFLLASALVKDNHEIAIATPTTCGPASDKFRKKFRIFDLKTNKPIKSTASLAKIIRQLNPDAVVCFGIHTGIAAALSKLLFGWKPTLIIRNENNISFEWRQGTALNRIIGPLLSRWAARRAHIISVSRALTPATTRYLHIDQTQVTTILNPALDDTATAATNSHEDLHPWLKDNSTSVFLAMGRLEHQKGFDILIDAFAKVRREHNARLLIFGQGSLQNHLQAQIDSHHLQDVITLAGYTDNPLAQMRAAHAFILSSRFEGFGLVLVEALWGGTQVISTNCDYGPAEILDNGNYGALVPTEDRDALASAMLESLRSHHAFLRPTNEWFAQFTATEAARQHVDLIESLRRDSAK
ncbi:Glycosyltransferase Gtf1 [compost metagenome]